jgi:hypothetical protein
MARSVIPLSIPNIKPMSRGRPTRNVRSISFLDPPAGFVGAWNSRTEWACYHALSKIFEDPVDPRRPPFTGARSGRWKYQTPFFGGRDELGGVVADFIVRMPNERDVVIDIVSGHYHTAAPVEKRAMDRARVQALASFLRYVPIYEIHLILDPTGGQACKSVVESLGGRRRIDPSYGTYQRARTPRNYGAS